MTDPLQYSGNEQETIDDPLDSLVDQLPVDLRKKVIEHLYGQEALHESGLIEPFKLPEPDPNDLAPVPEMPYSVPSLRPMLVQTELIEMRPRNRLKTFLKAGVGCLWFGLGMALAALGIGLCVTLVGAPLGLLALWGSGECGLRALTCWGLPAVDNYEPN